MTHEAVQRALQSAAPWGLSVAEIAEQTNLSALEVAAEVADLQHRDPAIHGPYANDVWVHRVGPAPRYALHAASAT